jgi:dolichyl-phosphate beta-glucosyltransferase
VSLSVVIPTFNEASGIARTIATVEAYLAQHHPGAELIIADDGSTDTTAEIITSLPSTKNVTRRLVSLPANRGKGAALRLGMEQTSGDIAAFFDADLAYPLEALEGGIEALRSGADLALGARDLTRDRDSRALYTAPRRLATHAFGAVVDKLLKLDVSDTQCGFKLFRGDVARRLFAELTFDGFAFDVELIWLAKKHGYIIERFPVAMRRGERSAVRLVRDSVLMLRDIISIARRR